MKKESLGKVEKTSRGFELVNFKDRYHVACSLQASSLADFNKPGTSAIWLGPKDGDPKVLASHADKYGIVTTETCGWITYPIPYGVMMSTRAHLDRKQVKALIAHLKQWLAKDTFAL